MILSARATPPRPADWGWARAAPWPGSPAPMKGQAKAAERRRGRLGRQRVATLAHRCDLNIHACSTVRPAPRGAQPLGRLQRPAEPAAWTAALRRPSAGGIPASRVCNGRPSRRSPRHFGWHGGVCVCHGAERGLRLAGEWPPAQLGSLAGCCWRCWCARPLHGGAGSPPCGDRGQRQPAATCADASSHASVLPRSRDPGASCR